MYLHIILKGDIMPVQCFGTIYKICDFKAPLKKTVGFFKMSVFSVPC